MIGVFKKNISYQSGCIIYDIYIGEHRDYEFLKQNIPNHILERYINDGSIELFQSNEELSKEEKIAEPVEPQNSIIQDKEEDGQVQNIDSQEIQASGTTVDEAQQQDENNIEIQDAPQAPIFETMYKITQPIQDKDGNEIELGTQFSESELKQIISQDKRQSKKKIAELLQDEKIMELKIVK